MREHTIVEMGGLFRAGLYQQGNGGFYRGDGLSVKHSVLPYVLS